MNTIFVVEAGVDYEGSSPIRAFAERYDADEFARECTEYQATRPQWPSDDLSEERIQKWSEADKAWCAAHPGGDVGSPDYFTVVEVPFGDWAAQDNAEGGK